MSPSDLRGFAPAGVSQLERALRRATEHQAPLDCNAKCGAHAEQGCAGFCAECWALVPEQLQLALATEPKVTILVVATDWVRGIRRERADAR